MKMNQTFELGATMPKWKQINCNNEMTHLLIYH